jgi:hypothetical protein
LQAQTAEISFPSVRLSGSHLTVDVQVENLSGHKFPTGFPSRRAWLHFVVRDAGGEVIFESGAVGDDGAIVGNDNDSDPQSFEPHYLAIVQPEQVQIYETILRDSSGQLTTSVLSAAAYLKDNRLLPPGYDKRSPYEDLAVRGRAADDEDFDFGLDQIQYAVEVGGAETPLTVTVELVYQTISYRWAEGLSASSTDLASRFLGYYRSIPNLPVVVASATVQVPAP